MFCIRVVSIYLFISFERANTVFEGALLYCAQILSADRKASHSGVKLFTSNDVL